MVEESNYQMAIDLLRCHLGITEEQAKEQLGLSEYQNIQRQVNNTQQALLAGTAEK